MKSLKNKLRNLKYSAKKRNIAVNLNVTYYSKLLELGCIYCGENLKEEKGYCLDRIDNNKGYVFDNVTPCCKICNRAKGNLSVDDFLNWAEKFNKFQQNVVKNIVYNTTEKQDKKILNKIKNSSSFKKSQIILISGDRK